MTTDPAPYALGPEQGEALWGIDGALTTIKASAEHTNGRFSLVEEIGQLSEGTPLHRHPKDDETFYVLEGDLTFYLEDGLPLAASAGSFVHLPAGTAHAYRVDSETARVLNVTTPQHESFFRAAGEPTPARELPRKDRPTWTGSCPRPTNTGWRYWAPHPAPPLSEDPVRPSKRVSPGSPHLVKCATPPRTRDDGTTAARVSARLVLTGVPKRRTML